MRIAIWVVPYTILPPPCTMFFCQPIARFFEVFAQYMHGKVYYTSVGTTYETFVTVSPYMDR